MTLPSPEKLEREKDRLYIDDAELYRWLGIDRRKAQPIIQQLEDKGGFPKKSPLWGKRYKPAVKAWLDRHNGLDPMGERP